ncbi:MAG: hypothetical protein JXA57_20525 [Armatimonadetes bacterium]|nr:hypothetical protein [Armatimonadota bacterium]
MPPDILTELLAGRHFNMEERKNLGLLPHEVLDYKEVRRHLMGVIAGREWFPRIYVPHEDGQLVHEGVVVQRLGRHRFVCHAEAARAIYPWILGDESHRRFRSARRAADYFLRWEHHLPGDLDGWKVL